MDVNSENNPPPRLDGDSLNWEECAHPMLQLPHLLHIVQSPAGAVTYGATHVIILMDLHNFLLSLWVALHLMWHIELCAQTDVRSGTYAIQLEIMLYSFYLAGSKLHYIVIVICTVHLVM